MSLLTVAELRDLTGYKRPSDQMRWLRAKSATDAEEQGIDPTRLLGHDKAETTRTYLRNRKAKVVEGPRLRKAR